MISLMFSINTMPPEEGYVTEKERLSTKNGRLSWDEELGRCGSLNGGRKVLRMCHKLEDDQAR